MRFLLILAFLTVAPSAGFAAENRLPCWARIFFENRNPPKITDEPIEDQVVRYAEELKKDLSPLANQQALIPRLGQIYVDVTNGITRRNGQPYPFYYLKEGIPQMAWLWAKLGPEVDQLGGDVKIRQTVERWIERYQSYPRDRDREIERTAAVQIASELVLAKLKTTKDSDFPLTMRSSRQDSRKVRRTKTSSF